MYVTIYKMNKICLNQENYIKIKVLVSSLSTVLGIPDRPEKIKEPWSVIPKLLHTSRFRHLFTFDNESVIALDE